MSNFYEQAVLSATSPRREYKLAEVSHRLVKIAFDVVRFKEDDQAANLWKIENREDGDYIVAMFGDEEELQKVASQLSPWKISRSGHHYLDVTYRHTLLTRAHAADLGIMVEDLDLVCEYLPKKLAENTTLETQFIKQLPQHAQQLLKKMVQR